MKPILYFALLSIGILQAEQKNWPAFRGNGQSLSEASDLSLEWSDEKNIAWDIPLKGYGQSSPVIWNNLVFATSVEGEDKETLRIDCFDLESGEAKWRKTYPASQTVAKSNYVSWAAPTPAVDENCIYAFFESGDVIALDHEGNEKWKRSLTKEYGNFGGNHGVGSSPALSSHGLVILIDHDGPSYLICLDTETGENFWKTDREKRVSWSSPIIAGSSDDEQILISSNGVAEAYDPIVGRQKWVVDDLKGNTVASPTPAGDVMILGSSEKEMSRAIRLGGKGDVSESHIAWLAEDAASSFGSPLVYQENVYFVNRAGVIFCSDLKTGKLKWNHRLPASTWASPIGHKDRVYFFSNNGTTTVLKADATEATELAVSPLKCESRLYGVAAVDENFVIRMESRLICIRQHN